MQDRYQSTFNKLLKEARPAFCPFAVLGHPTPKESLERIKKYLAAGADILELGIPFSDPIADGPTIQKADEQAIAAGTTPAKVLQLISQIRKLTEAQNQSGLPIGILTYANIVHHYGINKFYRDLKKTGADSILIADAPLEEIAPFALAAKQNQIHQIFIVSEYTTLERLRQIQKYASGFLYVVSTLGITGTRKTLNPKIHALIKNLQRYLAQIGSTKTLPLMIGFGISNSAQIQQLKKAYPQGLIIGSALVKTATKNLQKFAGKLKKSFLLN